MYTARTNWGALIFAVVVLVGSAAPAGAVGYWNMPTTLCQWWGYGCGPGYHAPMVLGPVTARELIGAGNEIRLRCAPRPSCAYGYAACGCAAGGSLLEPSVIPDAGPQPEPQPTALRPINTLPPGFLLQ